MEVDELQSFAEGKSCCECRTSAMRVLEICDTDIGALDQCAVSQLEDTVPVILTDIAVAVCLCEDLLIQDDVILRPSSCLRGAGEDQFQADMGVASA